MPYWQHGTLIAWRYVQWLDSFFPLCPTSFAPIIVLISSPPGKLWSQCDDSVEHMQGSPEPLD